MGLCLDRDVMTISHLDLRVRSHIVKESSIPHDWSHIPPLESLQTRINYILPNPNRGYIIEAILINVMPLEGVLG